MFSLEDILAEGHNNEVVLMEPLKEFYSDYLDRNVKLEDAVLIYTSVHHGFGIAHIDFGILHKEEVDDYLNEGHVNWMIEDWKRLFPTMVWYGFHQTPLSQVILSPVKFFMKLVQDHSEPPRLPNDFAHSVSQIHNLLKRLTIPYYEEGYRYFPLLNEKINFRSGDYLSEDFLIKLIRRFKKEPTAYKHEYGRLVYP